MPQRALAISEPRGNFPNEFAALKCLYLVTRSLDPTGTGRARWTMRWKPGLNAFAITLRRPIQAAETWLYAAKRGSRPRSGAGC